MSKLHPEVMKWIEDFIKTYDEKTYWRLGLSKEKKADWVGLANELAMMGVEGSDSCYCPTGLDPKKKEDEVLYSLHQNHIEFNTRVWYCLSVTCRKALRKVFQRDMKAKSQVFDDHNDEYGKIVFKRYAQKLLENFLLESPNPKWVDTSDEFYTRLVG